MTKRELYENMLLNKNGDSILPPPALKGMDIEFIEYVEGESIKFKAPILARYNNPGGVMFGGYFSMFFDAAFGPFSFIETQLYSTSLDLNVTFLKPLSPKDDYIITQANLVSQSKTFLLMEGKMWKADGALVATATSRMMILDRVVPPVVSG